MNSCTQFEEMWLMQLIFLEQQERMVRQQESGERMYRCGIGNGRRKGKVPDLAHLRP